MESRPYFLVSLLLTTFLTFSCGVQEAVDKGLSNASGADFINYNAAPEGKSGFLTGTAAIGAPLPNGIIKIKCSDGFLPDAATDAFGKWEVNVESCTAPYLIRAQGEVAGEPVDLLSVADTEDVGEIVNVTPLTHLISSSVIGDADPSAFEGFDVNSTSINKTKINNEKQKVKTLLVDIIKEATGKSNIDDIDLINTPFSTNHTGLDAVLDIVKVEVSSNTVNLNFIDGEPILSFNESSTLDDAITASTFTLDPGKIDLIDENINTYTHIDQILRDLINYVKQNAQQISSSSSLPVGYSDIFHSQFLDQGMIAKNAMINWFGLDDLAMFESEYANSQVEFANVNIVKDPVDTSLGTIYFDFIVDGVLEGKGIHLKIKKENNAWRLYGDQLPFGVHLNLVGIKEYNYHIPFGATDYAEEFREAKYIEVYIDEGAQVGNIRKVALYLSEEDANNNWAETSFDLGYEDWNGDGEHNFSEPSTVTDGVMLDGAWSRVGLEVDSSLIGQGRKEYIIGFTDENNNPIGEFKKVFINDPNDVDFTVFPDVSVELAGAGTLSLETAGNLTTFCLANESSYIVNFGQTSLDHEYFYGTISDSIGNYTEYETEFENGQNATGLNVTGLSDQTVFKYFSTDMSGISDIGYRVEVNCN